MALDAPKAWPTSKATVVHEAARSDMPSICRYSVRNASAFPGMQPVQVAHRRWALMCTLALRTQLLTCRYTSGNALG